MNQHDNILLELKQLSLVVAAIGQKNIYTVPEGYFEMLSSEVLLQVQSTHPQAISPEMKASVPEGYFEGLADTILAKIKIQSKHQTSGEATMSPLLAGIGNKNIFSVPEGYFDALPGEIRSGLPGAKQGLVVEETLAISRIVGEIGNRNVFTVPEGYFTQSAETLRPSLESRGRVVNMQRRFNVFKYAAAAVITGLLGLSVVSILNKKNTTEPTAQTSTVLSDAKQIIQTQSFDKEFSAVSDAAIVSYLESKGQDVEAALVASLIDEKNLPEADDYILNENTLDEVLKTLDLNN